MKFLIGLILAILFAPSLSAATYYIATAAGGGNDSNNGLTPTTPWLTPNHSVNCGDVILAAASTAYSYANFASGKWGTVTCAAGNNVAWVKCATFDACKIQISAVDAYGMTVSSSYWGVQGWEINISGTATQIAYASCFTATPPTTSANIHHIIFANDIANGCGGSGFSSENNGNASVDYFVEVGSVSYAAAQGNGECYSGTSIYQPVATDSLPGTHIYIAGNFAWDNVVPNPCASNSPTFDGEGFNLDTLDGSQGGLPAAYNQQVAVANNITFLNGASGISVEGGGNTAAHIYIKNNTLWGNNKDANQNTYYCGQVIVDTSPNQVLLTEVYGNLIATSQNTGGACASNPQYLLALYNGNGTDHIYANYGYSSAADNTISGGSSGFSFGPNNTFASFTFANPVDPGAPSCGSASSVPACMATVIANFSPTSTAAKKYGYQVPSSAEVYDPLFPQWLCSVTNLPAGLIENGCLQASASTGSFTGRMK